MVIRIRQPELEALKALQSEIEEIAGIKPALSEVLSRVVRDGVEVVRRRPALSMDVAGKAKA